MTGQHQREEPSPVGDTDQITALTKQLLNVDAERAAAVADAEQLRRDLDAANAARESLRGQVDALTADLAAARSERAEQANTVTRVLHDAAAATDRWLEAPVKDTLVTAATLAATALDR